MEQRTIRAVSTEFKTRAEDGKNPQIEGYFVRFDSIYDMGNGMTESIDRHAFDDEDFADVRALTNHDTTLVLGRTSAGTLSLTVDENGLFGVIDINPNDVDAMNTFARVERGDVNQCSFGFDILSEETDYREDGSVHWNVTRVKLYEVSVCTFPAYSETSVVAKRTAEVSEHKERELREWKDKMMIALKGERTDGN